MRALAMRGMIAARDDAAGIVGKRFGRAIIIGHVSLDKNETGAPAAAASR
jgi:hypothetical protein